MLPQIGTELSYPKQLPELFVFLLQFFVANILFHFNNTPIGIILCSGKNEALVKYATTLRRSENPGRVGFSCEYSTFYSLHWERL